MLSFIQSFITFSIIAHYVLLDMTNEVFKIKTASFALEHFLLFFRQVSRSETQNYPRIGIFVSYTCVFTISGKCLCEGEKRHGDEQVKDPVCSCRTRHGSTSGPQWVDL